MKVKQTNDSILLAEDVQRFENALDKLEQAGDVLQKMVENMKPVENTGDSDIQLNNDNNN
jgi:hypothetical protein